MWIFLLLPLLVESQGEVPAGAVELTVYRSRAELPEPWRKLLPDGFDWTREMVATSARPPQAVVLSDEIGNTARRRGSLYIWRKHVPAPSDCPICRGAPTLDSESPIRRPMPAPVLPLFRLARFDGRVFEAPGLAVTATQGPYCPPCTAP